MDTVPPAVALKKSLTAEQQQALSAVLDRHASQLGEITRQLRNPAKDSRQATPADGQQPSIDSVQIEAHLKGTLAEIEAAKATLAQLQGVQSQIDTETASILSPEQLALHKEATSAVVKSLEIADAQVRSATAPWAKADATAAADVTTCGYAAQYASVARYWAILAYNSAYYNYVYYDNDTYAYNAHIYLYYAQYYGYYAGQYLGGAFFDLAHLGSDFNSNGYYGAGNEYNTQYYAYHGHAYAYANFYHTAGSNYAYSAYAYGLHAYNNAYYGYNYGLSCF